MASRGNERPSHKWSTNKRPLNGDNEKDEFEFPPPGATQEELENASTLLGNVFKLSGACFNHISKVRHKLLYELGRLPNEQEVSGSLDEGHLEWYVMWEKIKDLSGEDIGRFRERVTWYQQWVGWFQENYPEYFSSGEDQNP